MKGFSYVLCSIKKGRLNLVTENFYRAARIRRNKLKRGGRRQGYQMRMRTLHSATDSWNNSTNSPRGQLTRGKQKRTTSASTRQSSSTILPSPVSPPTPTTTSMSSRLNNSFQNTDDDDKETEGPVLQKRKQIPSPFVIPDHITVHSGSPPMYQCNVCSSSRKFKTKAHIKYHELCGGKGDDNDRPFNCETCGQGFISKSHLECHSRTHTGDQRTLFDCAYCDERFTSMTRLKKHVIIHTDERPFSCPHCSKSFGLKWTLDLHLRSHSSELPFPCDQCNRAFSNSNQLKLHLLIHSGVRPFKCWRCGIAFRRKANLEKHIHTTHNQSKELAKQLANEAAAEYLKQNSETPSTTGGNVTPVSKLNSIVIANSIRNNDLTPAGGLLLPRNKKLSRVDNGGGAHTESIPATSQTPELPDEEEGNELSGAPANVVSDKGEEGALLGEGMMAEDNVKMMIVDVDDDAKEEELLPQPPLMNGFVEETDGIGSKASDAEEVEDAEPLAQAVGQHENSAGASSSSSTNKPMSPYRREEEEAVANETDTIQQEAKCDAEENDDDDDDDDDGDEDEDEAPKIFLRPFSEIEANSSSEEDEDSTPQRIPVCPPPPSTLQSNQEDDEKVGKGQQEQVPLTVVVYHNNDPNNGRLFLDESFSIVDPNDHSAESRMEQLGEQAAALLRLLRVRMMVSELCDFYHRPHIANHWSHRPPFRNVSSPILRGPWSPWSTFRHPPFLPSQPEACSPSPPSAELGSSFPFPEERDDGEEESTPPVTTLIENDLTSTREKPASPPPSRPLLLAPSTSTDNTNSRVHHQSPTTKMRTVEKLRFPIPPAPAVNVLVGDPEEDPSASSRSSDDQATLPQDIADFVLSSMENKEMNRGCREPRKLGDDDDSDEDSASSSSSPQSDKEDPIKDCCIQTLNSAEEEAGDRDDGIPDVSLKTLEQLQTQRENLESPLNSIEGDQADSLQLSADMKREKLEELKARAKGVRSQIEMKKRNINALSTRGNNKYAVYRRKVEQLVAKIQANLHKFGKPPRGPLGACFSVKDPDYALLVQAILYNNLDSFVVDNTRDWSLLREYIDSIFKEGQSGLGSIGNMKPAIIIMSFAKQMYDVSSALSVVNHPSAHNLLQLLEIKDKDPVVMNTLIDLAEVQKILLFPDSPTANRVLKTESPLTRGMKCGFTLLSWERLTPAPAFAARGIQLKSRPGFVQGGGNGEAEKEVLLSELRQLETELRNLEAQRAEMREQIK